MDPPRCPATRWGWRPWPYGTPRQVDPDHVGPHLEFFFDGQLAEGHRGNARVGAHDVEATEVLNPGVQRGPHCCEVTDVGDCAEHLGALAFHQCDGLLEFVPAGHRVAVGGNVGADVDADDVGPVGGEPERVAATLPAGDSRDEGDLTVQRTHNFSLRRGARRCATEVCNSVTAGTVTLLQDEGKGLAETMTGAEAMAPDGRVAPGAHDRRILGIVVEILKPRATTRSNCGRSPAAPVRRWPPSTSTTAPATV